MHIIRFIALSALTLWAMPHGLSADDDYTVNRILPQVGQAGTVCKVIVEGRFLENVREVIFYQPGIRCTNIKPHAKRLESRSGTYRDCDPGFAVELTLEIAGDARLGEYQLRIRTADNLSEMLTFWVTPYPVIAEQTPWKDIPGSRNDSREHAQAVPLNTTVYGYLPGSEPQDHDWFRVKCKQGQTLSVEAIAARLGTLHYGGMNDPAIRVYDGNGRELARNDDNSFSDQDPVVSFIVPQTGEYFIHFHQQMDYEAGRLRHYLLHIGNFPRPLVVYPLGGRVGSRQKMAFLGGAQNPVIHETVLPTRAGPFEHAYFSVADSTTKPPPTPNRIHLSELPNVYEQPGNTSESSPQVIDYDAPLAINGRISERGQIDWYRFRAQKGQRYRVRSISSTLGSDLDARVWIRPAPGNPSQKSYDEDDSKWEPHDLVAHHYRHQTKERLDPIFMFEPDRDGEWLLGVGDTRREFGPQHLYRIEFQPHVDSVFVHFEAYPSVPKIVRDRVVVFPDHHHSRPIAIMNGFGSRYNKPLQLRIEGLPAGVTVNAPTFKASDRNIPITFHAERSSKPSTALVDVVVEPVDPADREQFRGGFVQMNQATNRRGDYAMYFNRTRKMAVAVCDQAPFEVTVEQPRVPLVRDGEIELTVQVQRHEGFDGDIYLEADWLPNGVNKQPPMIIRSDDNAGTYKLRATSNAPSGEYNFSITGRENSGGFVRTGAGFHYVSSRPVRLSVGDPFVSVKLTRSAIERGKTGQILAKIEHHKPYAGKATLKLGRLPFGVQQVEPIPSITSSDSTATFHVHVTADCLIGQYKQIFCDVAVPVDDQILHQQTGDGILRVDPERN